MTVKRRYDASRRRQRARHNRQAVLAAATRLFVDPGYAATSIATVAAEAGVSVQTIYAAFGSKRQLLSTLVDVTIAGDDEPVPLAQRPFVDHIRATDDPREKLSRYAEHLVETHRRQAAVMLAMASAASADVDVAAVLQKNQQEQRAGMTMFAQNLLSTGRLRADVDIQTIADVLCLAMDVRNYDWLVRRCGWSDDRFQQWYVDTVAGALLPSEASTPPAQA